MEEDDAYEIDYFDDDEDESMQVDHHGGHCCGVRHLSGFGDRHDQATEDRLVRLMSDTRRVITNNNAGMNRDAGSDTLFEACLIEYQMDQGGWREPLRRLGFRVVTKFRNMNSNNVVYVLHHVTRIPLRNVRGDG